jgi:tetratricopeptide (TPR) repeat protein
MPAKKKDASNKPRKSSIKKETSEPQNVSVNIRGDVKKSNVVIGDDNSIVDNSQTTVNLNNERDAPVTIHANQVKVDNKTHPKLLIFYGLLVVFLAGIVLSILNYVWFRFDRIIAGGDLNVLIVPFVEEEPWGYVNTDLGWGVAQILAEGTRDAFESSGSETNLKIFGPADKVPQMLYLLSEKQLDREAEKISEEINGQIVIYGVISKDEYGDSIVTTKVYISPTNFGEAQELISDSMMGELSLGSFRLTGDTVSGADLLAQNKELRDRLEIFSSIINFLGAYVGEDFDRADEHITRAENESLWSNANGLEVIYLIHGNMQIRQARIAMVNKDLEQSLEITEQAKQNFEKANDVSMENGNGSYVRAYLGLAGAEGLRAIAEANINNDVSLIDTAALERSLDYFDEAQNAKYQPETADVAVKVNYGKAQVALAYFAKTGDAQYLEEARSNYQLVVDEYEKKRNTRINEFAALAHSGLGHITRQNGEHEIAIEHFLSAQEITVNPSLKVQCLANVGDIYFANEQYSQALKYYQDVLLRRSDIYKALSSERISEIERKIDAIKNGGSL